MDYLIKGKNKVEDIKIVYFWAQPTLINTKGLIRPGMQ